MPLYKRRLGSIELRAEGLYDKEGNEISSLTAQEVELIAGGKKVTVRLSKDRSSIEIECEPEQTPFKSRSESGFRILL